MCRPVLDLVHQNQQHSMTAAGALVQLSRRHRSFSACRQKTFFKFLKTSELFRCQLWNQDLVAMILSDGKVSEGGLKKAQHLRNGGKTLVWMVGVEF